MDGLMGTWRRETVGSVSQGLWRVRFMNHHLSSSQRAGDCHCFRPRCKLQESSLCKLSCLGLFLRVWVALTRDHLPREAVVTGCEAGGRPRGWGECGSHSLWVPAGEWAVACGGWVTMGCRPPGGNAGGPRGASVSGCCHLSVGPGISVAAVPSTCG